MHTRHAEPLTNTSKAPTPVVSLDDSSTTPLTPSSIHSLISQTSRLLTPQIFSSYPTVPDLGLRSNSDPSPSSDTCTTARDLCMRLLSALETVSNGINRLRFRVPLSRRVLDSHFFVALPKELESRKMHAVQLYEGRLAEEHEERRAALVRIYEHRAPVWAREGACTTTGLSMGIGRNKRPATLPSTVRDTDSRRNASVRPHTRTVPSSGRITKRRGAQGSTAYSQAWYERWERRKHRDRAKSWARIRGSLMFLQNLQRKRERLGRGEVVASDQGDEDDSGVDSDGDAAMSDAGGCSALELIDENIAQEEDELMTYALEAEKHGIYMAFAQDERGERVSLACLSSDEAMSRIAKCSEPPRSQVAYERMIGHSSTVGHLTAGGIETFSPPTATEAASSTSCDTEQDSTRPDDCLASAFNTSDTSTSVSPIAALAGTVEPS